MAIGDYILCCKCEVKLIYDGDRDQREWWEERFGKEPEIECPNCKPQRTEQEPVATVTSETGADITMSWWHEPALPVGTKLFTYAPQRTWIDLTDDEIDNINYTSAHMLAREVLAKFKEKNNA